VCARLCGDRYLVLLGRREQICTRHQKWMPKWAFHSDQGGGGDLIRHGRSGECSLSRVK
jgi:hypothetical protein